MRIKSLFKVHVRFRIKREVVCNNTKVVAKSLIRASVRDWFLSMPIKVGETAISGAQSIPWHRIDGNRRSSLRSRKRTGIDDKSYRLVST